MLKKTIGDRPIWVWLETAMPPVSGKEIYESMPTFSGWFFFALSAGINTGFLICRG